MNFHIISRTEQDLGRGCALLIFSALMMLLKLVVPFIAPLALGAYAIYRLLRRSYLEALICLGVGVLLWYFQALVGGLFFIIAGIMVGLGLFFLIRGIRERGANDDLPYHKHG